MAFVASIVGLLLERGKLKNSCADAEVPKHTQTHTDIGISKGIAAESIR
jgi:hypothetical protein